jgi:glycosyltransferase involved in cell wall biosynthesis
LALRVTYITHYAQLYGANRSLLGLIGELRRRGVVEPHVLLPEPGPLVAELQKQDVPFEVIGFRPWMTARHHEGGPHHRLAQYLRYQREAQRNAAANRKLLPEVARLLKKWRTDVIHLNSLAVGLGVHLVSGAMPPVIWHAREMPEQHYGLHVDSGRRAYARALRSASRIVANSEATKQDVQRYVGRDTPVEVIHNGVFSVEDHTRWGIGGMDRWQRTSPFIFLLVGVIHPSKGQEEVVRAMAIVKRRFPNVRLRIIGEGRTDHLRGLLDQHELHGMVELLGHQDGMEAFYREAHALLVCSRNEAFGRVAVEAMAHGLPVIGRAEGGTLEVLDQGRQGLLYTDGPAQLADRMMELLADPVRARDLGERGRIHALEHFTIERCAAKILDVYRSIHG